MERLLAIMLSNALLAGAAALLAWVAGRFLRRPAVAHALWLVVLLKLVTPPIWSVPLLHVHVAPKHVATARTVRVVEAKPSERRNDVVAEKEARDRFEPNRSMGIVSPDLDKRAGSSDTIADGEISPENKPEAPPAPQPDASSLNSTGIASLPDKAIEHPISAPLPQDQKTPALATTPATPASPTVPLLSRIPWDWLRSWRSILITSIFLVWLAGSLYCLVVTLARIVRFRRLLKYATLAGPDVQRQACALARRIGLPERSVPGVWLVPGAVCPMLWAGLGWRGRRGGGTRVLVPEQLWAELDPFQRRTLLAHELAHLHRRDHWVRWIELGATVLYWWDPMCWWTRQQLREAEEQCCDAWVLRLMPGSFRAYAEALLAAVEFVSTAGSVRGGAAAAAAPRPMQAVPALASGMGQFGHLKRRLTMLKQNPIAAHALLGKAGLVAACAAAALLLPLTPTVARQQDAQDRKQQEDQSIQKVEQQSKDEVIDAAPVAPHVVTVTSDVHPDVAVTPSVAPVAVEVTSTRDLAVAPTQVRTESDPIFTFADGQSSDLAVAGDPNSIDDPFRSSDSGPNGNKIQKAQKAQQDRAARELARAQADVERLNKRLDDAKERLAKAQAQLMRAMPTANGKGGYLIAPPAANGQFNPKSMWSAPGASYFPGFGRPMAQGAQPGAGVGQAGGPGGGFRGGVGGGYVQSDDRDRRMDRLERQLEQLMKEVRALRTENSNNNENDSNNWNTPNPGMRK